MKTDRGNSTFQGPYDIDSVETLGGPPAKGSGSTILPFTHWSSAPKEIYIQVKAKPR